MADSSFPRFEYWVTATAYGPRWFWHLKAANGQIIAIGGEGFSSSDALKISVSNVCSIVPIAAKKTLVLV